MPRNEFIIWNPDDPITSTLATFALLVKKRNVVEACDDVGGCFVADATPMTNYCMGQDNALKWD